MNTVKISSKNQVTIPVKILRNLGLESGSHVILKERIINNKRTLSFIPAPTNLTEYYQGAGTKTIKKLGGVKFLKELKSEWI